MKITKLKDHFTGKARQLQAAVRSVNNHITPGSIT